MKKFVCAFVSGGDFKQEHVLALKRQVEWALPSADMFICYSDIKIEGVYTRPLISGYKKQMVMQEVFREKGHVIVTGLDTIFMKKCDWIWSIPVNNNVFYGIKPWRDFWGNSVMLWKGDWSDLFYNYTLENCTNKEYRNEQMWSYRKLKELGADIRFMQQKSLEIVSYKHHCKKEIPQNVDIIIFHGKPRPWQVTNNDLINNYYWRKNKNET